MPLRQRCRKATLGGTHARFGSQFCRSVSSSTRNSDACKCKTLHKPTTDPQTHEPQIQQHHKLNKRFTVCCKPNLADTAWARRAGSLAGYDILSPHPELLLGFVKQPLVSCAATLSAFGKNTFRRGKQSNVGALLISIALGALLYTYH